METTPYWIASASVPLLPKLGEDLKVDVVVVGGGITGITAAYLLKKSGKAVALLERDEFACVDTGHTTAHLTYVTDARLHDLVKDFGEDHAQAAWDAGAAAIEQIEEIIRTEKIDAEFTHVPGYLHAPVDAGGSVDTDSLKEDAELARELGFDASYMEEAPFVKRPGIRFANQAKFHPRKYLDSLLNAIPGEGSYAFQESKVEEILDEPLRVKVNGHEIRCGRIVIATHVPLQGLVPTVSAALFQTKLAPYTSYAVGAKIRSGLVPEASFWDTADPYYYLRIDRHDGHDYAILGGADHKTGQAEDPEKHFARVTERLLAMLPAAAVNYRWSGQVIETSDGLPFIGETASHQFIATGFSGNGMTFGTLGAMMACDFVKRRKNPWRELFDVNRKPVPGGIWDYLKENKDYPFYFLKDRIGGAGAASLDEIRPGEGKVVQLKGGKVAAFRDQAGRLTVRSAVCTHMGCIVRWNATETTWDCPCHGSRFRATGEVIGGPAEAPLADAAE